MFGWVGWILLALTWVFHTQVSDEWKQMNWSMTCKEVKPQIVYKIPEPHMIIETLEKETCLNGDCDTKVWRTVKSLDGEVYPAIIDKK